MKRIERIEAMEALLNECREELRAVEEVIERFCALQDKMKKLSAYYGSASWYADREADEKGKLPENLARGVLSEDLVYDVITDSRDAAIRMLEVATDALRNL